MNIRHTPRGSRIPAVALLAVLALAALLVAACGPTAAPPVAQVTQPPATVATASTTAPAATLALTTAPAATLAPTAAPTSTPTSAPAATLAPTTAPTLLPATGPSPTVAAGEAEVELENYQFHPAVLTVKAGTRVKFANKDDVQHTVTSDTNLFDSGYLGKGDEFFFTFTQPGEYPYYCIPHGGPNGVGMSGTIVVVP